MKSIIYLHPRVYKVVMRILYGKAYTRSYELIAKEAKDMKILDLCCGDCKLAEYINDYKGIDFNNIFVKYAKKRGIDVTRGDILKDEIPKSECIVMTGSLYQFIPHHEYIIRKMLKKAKKVIISESGIHLAKSKNPLIAIAARRLTNISGAHKNRFTKNQLFGLYKKLRAKKIIDSGRDVIGIFEK